MEPSRHGQLQPDVMVTRARSRRFAAAARAFYLTLLLISVFVAWRAVVPVEQARISSGPGGIVRRGLLPRGSSEQTRMADGPAILVKRDAAVSFGMISS